MVHLQRIPGHPSLPGSDLADTLANLGATHDPSTMPLFLSPLIFSHPFTPVGDTVSNWCREMGKSVNLSNLSNSSNIIYLL